MTDREPVEVTNLDRYGSPPLPWSRPHDLLVASPAQPGTPYFLGTSRPDGRPHAASLGAAWLDGDLYFTSGPGTRKARNLAANPACTFAVGLEGIDLVLEGEAARITDPPTLERVARLYREGGWPAEVQGDAFTAPFSAPSAGPPPRNRTARLAGASNAEGRSFRSAASAACPPVSGSRAAGLSRSGGRPHRSWQRPNEVLLERRSHTRGARHVGSLSPHVMRARPDLAKRRAREGARHDRRSSRRSRRS